MFPSFTTLLLSASIATLSLTANASPTPFHNIRAVKELNKEATAEAHTRDAGATRSFEGVEIKVTFFSFSLWYGILRMFWLMLGDCVVDFRWKLSVF